jgi:alpha-beta hydrolase superfamily lysophospholipase
VETQVGGDALRGLHWAPKGKAKGAVLLVHGFNSSLEEFGRAPEWFAAAGYHALAFDQRGFGRSSGERGRTDVDRAVVDIAAAGALLHGLAPRLPLFVVGHSLGAAYTAAALGRGAVDAKAAVLAHPVDRLFDEVHPVLRPMYHALGKWTERRMAKGKPARLMPYRSSSRVLFVDVGLARQAGRPDFLLKHSNLGNYRAATTMSASAWARDVRVPTLFVTSPRDRVVKPANMRKVYAALSGTKAEFEHGGGHSCFRDLDGRRIADACIGWFDSHLGAA